MHRRLSGGARAGLALDRVAAGRADLQARHEPRRWRVRGGRRRDAGDAEVSSAATSSGTSAPIRSAWRSAAQAIVTP
ncbi:MAG TPA: hypothetical protein VFK02_02875 [Kofleriaceae bacterium]|nr:hypothetical protein [Kofleriaceae bacterium]